MTSSILSVRLGRWGAESAHEEQHTQLPRPPVPTPWVCQSKAKRALREILYAATMDDAEESFDVFVNEVSPKYEKAVECLAKDRERLLSFFEFPAEHWKHLRSTNPIESAFATVRLRQRVTKGAGNRTKALMMAFKLLAMAEQRWRKLNGAHLLPLVRAGVEFEDGRPVERTDNDQKEAA